MSEEKVSTVKSKENTKSEVNDCNKKLDSNGASYIVDYGPIRVRHRRSKSQTLATGRRSRDEPLYGEEAIKRELRREKNRIAARHLKRTRDQIESDLLETIKELEHEQKCLEEQHKKLEERKAQLNRAVYNAKQAPFIPLITDINIPILFGPQKRRDLLIDLQPLLKNLDEKCSMSDN
ncbi:unnamed protein product [Rotaria sp. Silwood2]|nr:unnamed protein product [Rotaria sp. Silwood2]CAF2528104.1 unnamed protein product [Rotaria sp. Silwood2]CAF2760320.1 unnamed protein product [Rotaria sp. Silwood2]CAF2938159.1 unnamed protein product [Rotaria sp. Silwood2]CAF3853383.1 unnamed protein product [Rotaria sp. Silwood2]